MPLSPQQRDDLEDKALRVLGGSARRDLVNGIRIMSSSGPQLAAVYWSNLSPGNEIEIALCDSRISEKYDIGLIQRWIEHQKARWPAQCNTHQAGSDWPIFGLSYAESSEFFKSLYRLRQGFLRPEERRSLESMGQAHSEEQAAEARVRAELASLRPNRRYAVYDLVYRAGVSVEPWSLTADRTPVASPRSNPAYCYNWSFGGGAEPTVVCFWHEAFKIESSRIVYRGNIRDAAAELDDIASRSGEHPDVKMRARNQASRARALDDLIQKAATTGGVLRVIVNEGRMRSEKDLGRDSSEVKVRMLDSAPWRVEEYDVQTGAFNIVRVGSPVVNAAADRRSEQPRPADPRKSRFTDQFEVGNDDPQKISATVQTFARNAGVRTQVLERAQGACEYCNAPGFVTRSGAIYLETHHVLPLAESGPDRVWNVVALCPNDHRQAHFSEHGSAMREELLEFLEAQYPGEVQTMRG